MSLSQFDGLKFNTNGGLRVIRKKDGHYVVGQKMKVAVGSKEEGEDFINILQLDNAAAYELFSRLKGR